MPSGMSKRYNQLRAAIDELYALVHRPASAGAGLISVANLVGLLTQPPMLAPEGTPAFVQNSETQWAWYPTGKTPPPGATTSPGNGGVWALVQGNLAGTGTSPTIMWGGDSLTFGNDGTYQGQVGGYSGPAIQYLRSFRSDFDCIGSLIANPDNAPGSSLPFNEGHTGTTIATWGAGYAGYCASVGVGVPRILVLMLGTNNVTGGFTLAQMQADTITTYADIKAVDPTTIILHMAPPAFVAGTTYSGAPLLTANALVAAYTAWLQNTWIPSVLATTGQTAIFCPASTLTGPGDYQPDGKHWNQGGNAVAGVAVAQQPCRCSATRRARMRSRNRSSRGSRGTRRSARRTPTA